MLRAHANPKPSKAIPPPACGLYSTVLSIRKARTHRSNQFNFFMIITQKTSPPEKKTHTTRSYQETSPQLSTPGATTSRSETCQFKKSYSQGKTIYPCPPLVPLKAFREEAEPSKNDFTHTMALTKAAASAWGDTLNKARQGYTAVVSPATMYRASVWHSPKETCKRRARPAPKSITSQKKCPRSFTGGIQSHKYQGCRSTCRGGLTGPLS